MLINEKTEHQNKPDFGHWNLSLVIGTMTIASIYTSNYFVAH